MLYPVELRSREPHSWTISSEAECLKRFLKDISATALPWLQPLSQRGLGWDTPGFIRGEESTISRDEIDVYGFVPFVDGVHDVHGVVVAGQFDDG